MVVASIRYPLQMPQVMKGFSSRSFTVWYILEADRMAMDADTLGFLNPVVATHSVGYAKPRDQQNQRTLCSISAR